MFNYDADLALKAHLKDESLLWHKRLGHIHSQGLKELKNMVYGLPQVEDNNEVCEGCAMGKHHRNFFQKEDRGELGDCWSLFTLTCVDQ